MAPSGKHNQCIHKNKHSKTGSKLEPKSIRKVKSACVLPKPKEWTRHSMEIEVNEMEAVIPLINSFNKFGHLTEIGPQKEKHLQQRK